MVTIQKDERGSMARQLLSNVDTAWLRMEEPTNLMMIAGVLIFGAPLDFERLTTTIEHGLLRFDRFRRRVVPLPLGRFCWEDDPAFDLSYHLQRVALPSSGDQAALQELVSRLVSAQLDFSRPLWQFHLVERYNDGCALICRLHHSIADGIALVHVLLSLTTDSPDTPWTVPQPRPGQRSRPVISLRPEPWPALADPGHAAELARTGAAAVTALGRLVLRWPDPRTVLKGSLGVPKRVAWSRPLPLADVKAIGKRLGGTVNDVLLTAVTGGLRRYLQAHGEPVTDLNLRAVVPVNLRPLEAEPDLGNRFGLVFLSLPVDIAAPDKRLPEVKRRMAELKGSLEAPVAFSLLSLVGLTPACFQEWVIDLLGAKATAVMTNVRGPQEKRYLAGAPLESLIFWVPQSGRLGMGVSILSYAGQVCLGFITDAGLVPDPEALLAGTQAEFEALLALARQTPEPPNWPEMKARLDEALASLAALLG